jgi:hypothetical protein
MKTAATWAAAIAIALLLAYQGDDTNHQELTQLSVSDSINAAKVASKE